MRINAGDRLCMRIIVADLGNVQSRVRTLADLRQTEAGCRIDHSGKYRQSLAVDAFRTRGHSRARTDRGDSAILNDHGPVFDRRPRNRNDFRPDDRKRPAASRFILLRTIALCCCGY